VEVFEPRVEADRRSACFKVYVVYHHRTVGHEGDRRGGERGVGEVGRQTLAAVGAGLGVCRVDEDERGVVVIEGRKGGGVGNISSDQGETFDRRDGRREERGRLGLASNMYDHGGRGGRGEEKQDNEEDLHEGQPSRPRCCFGWGGPRGAAGR